MTTRMSRLGTHVRKLVGATLLLACWLALPARPLRAAPPDHAADVERVVQLTNAARESAGLPPLALNPQLGDAAQNYSQVLASDTCFGHACGGVPNFADRLAQAGYTGWTAIAENIAAGYPTPDAVMAGWLASTGHRLNVLSPEYTEIGVGVVNGGAYGTYWTQEFGSRPQVGLNAPPGVFATPTAAGQTGNAER
ncbi:MAG: CAP domain-containing protein [Chloroflexota bacterium]|nr:CAP domain-containing protein [Chloroflexota bacterium]